MYANMYNDSMKKHMLTIRVTKNSDKVISYNLFIPYAVLSQSRLETVIKNEAERWNVSKLCVAITYIKELEG